MVTNITLLWAGGGREEEEGDDPQVAEEPAAGQHEGGAGEESYKPGQSDRAHADQAAWQEKEKPGIETTVIPNHTLDYFDIHSSHFVVENVHNYFDPPGQCRPFWILNLGTKFKFYDPLRQKLGKIWNRVIFLIGPLLLNQYLILYLIDLIIIMYESFILFWKSFDISVAWLLFCYRQCRPTQRGW